MLDNFSWKFHRNQLKCLKVKAINTYNDLTNYSLPGLEPCIHQQQMLHSLLNGQHSIEQHNLDLAPWVVNFNKQKSYFHKQRDGMITWLSSIWMQNGTSVGLHANWILCNENKVHILIESLLIFPKHIWSNWPQHINKLSSAAVMPCEQCDANDSRWTW